ncbi:MAG: 3-oxoacyl-[acyl-carrier-protein] reductase [Actinomycetota bacterium]|nr:3-oxoacyl-[acyl-carrier-protein] reductase [Actinomycetota bacterium]
MAGLEGKVAVVTGSARGIGRAICLKLAQLGADVVVNAVSSEEMALGLVKEIKGMGRKAIFVKANIANVAEARKLMDETVEKFGKIDILVNNAGITRDNLILRMKEEEWDAVLNVNLKGTFNCVQAATKYMIKQRQGAIVNIASIIGIAGNAGQANYSASKAGIIGLTKTIARELASRGIRANAIAPGFIETDMTRRLSEEVRERLIKQIPLTRLGSPEDVANLVAFLASEESSYITGEVIKVDGGMIA